MTKDSNSKNLREVHTFPSVDEISQNLATNLETELLKFVTHYKWGESYPFDLTMWVNYVTWLEWKFRYILKTTIQEITKDWSDSKIKEFYQYLLAPWYVIWLSKELALKFTKVKEIDYWYYKDFPDVITYWTIPMLAKVVEEIINEKTKPIETNQKWFSWRVRDLLWKIAA